MTKLPQKYQDVVKEIIPYVAKSETHQMALISINPALPCFLCNNPASDALVAPAPEYARGAATPWITFPICQRCEETQIGERIRE